MRRIFVYLLPLFASVISRAQTITVGGTVSDQQGKPLPFVFLRDSQHSFATMSDLLGNYSFRVDPASKIVASAVGFKEAATPVNNKTTVNVVMEQGISEHSNGKALNTSTSTDIFKPDQGVAVTKVSDYVRVNDALHGSRFLSEKWMHGFALSYTDSLIQNNEYFFNYDKTMSDLLFTRDQRAVFAADKQEVKAFTIVDDSGVVYNFESVPSIDPKHYTMVLSTGDKYKVYRSLTCKLVKANFTTNGITSSGNNYDEYKDESVYYVVKPGGQPQKFELKSKSIKLAFAADADKVKKFFSDNEGDIDDNYLKALGDYLNQ